MAMRLPERIPPLAGRWLTAYRVLWVPVFLLALVGATFGTHAQIELNRAYGATIYRLGLLATERDGHRYFKPLRPDTRPGGIEPDSLLLAIDGISWSRPASYVETRALIAALGGREGQIHRLKLRAPDGRIGEFALPIRQANLDAFDARSPLSYATRIALLAFIQMAIGAMFLAAAALLFLRRAREPVVALLALGFVVGFAEQAANVTGNGPLIAAVGQIDLETLFIATALAVFPAGRFEPRWTFVAIAIAVLHVTVGPWVPQGLDLFLAVPAAATIVAANVVRYRRLGSVVERQQIKWATLGIAVSLFLLIAGAMLGFVQGTANSPAVAVFLSVSANVARVLGVACLVGGLLVSLLRYRLYDADTVLSRSAVYGALALAMIAVFAGTEKLVELLAEQYWGESVGVAAGAIAAGLAAAVIPLFHTRLQHWAKRRFQGPLLALREGLPEDLRDWRQTEDAPALAAQALERVTDALHSQTGAIVSTGAEHPLLAARGLEEPELTQSHDALPLRIPLGRLADGGEGFLLLGPRPDGSMPGKDERAAAHAIADPLARALTVAQRRHRHEQDLRDVLATLASRLTKLEKRRT
jgi:hypothetical protein